MFHDTVENGEKVYLSEDCVRFFAKETGIRDARSLIFPHVSVNTFVRRTDADINYTVNALLRRYTVQ